MEIKTSNLVDGLIVASASSEWQTVPIISRKVYQIETYTVD